ncbi:MAG TPA: hypothetical protein VK892_19825 [Pyrinomonadaceae bacterium]|nr:hypothetical protein [Pyrinomonadaceae bacterium]
MKKLLFQSLLFVLAVSIQVSSIFAQSSEIVGSWKNGSVGTIQYQNSATGATKPGRGSVFSYKFLANGNYEFAGYMETTMYNCTTSLFNEIKGKYAVEGSTITLNPARDFWKSTNSCFASGNKEQLKTPQKSVYEIEFKKDDYENRLLCLTNEKGESCFKRE